MGARPVIALEVGSLLDDARKGGSLARFSSATEERVFRDVLGIRRAEQYIAGYTNPQEVYASGHERRQARILASSYSATIRRRLRTINGILANASSEQRERLLETISYAEGYISAHNKQSPVKITL